MDALTPRVLAAWFALLLILSVFSRWHPRYSHSDRCSLDGNRIVPVRQVDLMSNGRVLASFCSVTCAGDWPPLDPLTAGAYWRVRDEVTGDALDASAACFVESSVMAVASRRDRVHVFADWSAAMNHLAEYGGERLPNPLPTAPGKSGR